MGGLPPSRPGIHCQCTEISVDSVSEDRVPGVSNRLCAGSIAAASSESEGHQTRIAKALACPFLSLRRIARVVGLLASSIQEIFPGPLHYRALQRLKIEHLRRGAPYPKLVPMSLEAREELKWWLHHMEACNCRVIFVSLPDIVIDSDASRFG